MNTPIAVFTLALATVSLSGCLPIVEGTTRTRVLEDGTTIRHTRYVKVRRKADDEDQKRWNARPIREDLGRDLGHGFAVETTDDSLKLEGVFPGPSEMPADFRRDVADLGATSSNRVEFTTEDLLFGTRYIWRETFVDAVKPESQGAARTELLRFVAAQIKRAAALEFDAGYELARFDTYVDDDLRPAMNDLVDVFWKERRRLGERDPITGRTGADRLLEKGAARLAKLGLRVDVALEDDVIFEHARDWLSRTLAATLDPKDDAQRRPTPTDFRYLFPADDPGAGLRVALERVAHQDFGSVEAAERAFKRRLYALTGTYGSPPAEAEFKFDCAIELPGVLLRTNGWVEGPNSAFWRFTGEDLFPGGYSMEAESAVLSSPLLGRLRELKPQLDRRDAVDLIRALKKVSTTDRARMKELLTAAARSGTTEAIAADPDRPGDEEIVKRLRTVLQAIERP